MDEGDETITSSNAAASTIGSNGTATPTTTENNDASVEQDPFILAAVVETLHFCLRF